jgi:hypothetical protein
MRPAVAVLLAALAALAALSGGCASFDAAIASPREAAAWRATRVAPSAEARLAAASRYLAEYPQGRFRERVRAFLGEVEPLFWQARRESAAGLRAYLDALPDGPHAAEARDRLALFQRRVHDAEAERLAARALATEARLEAQARARRAAIDTFTGWVATAAAFDGWGSPLDPASLGGLLRGDAARCTEAACRRTVSIPYAVVAAGQTTELEATLELAAELDGGSVRRIVVAGPELFTRLYEAGEDRLAPDHERAARFAAELVAGAVEARLPAERCAAPSGASGGAAAPVRACDGRRVEVIAGAAPGDDDRVVVEPLAR